MRAAVIVMDSAERVRTYTAFAESTHRWVSVMDTKAGFLFAVNGALLTFMWVGARLGDVVLAAQWLAIGASLCSLLASRLVFTESRQRAEARIAGSSAQAPSRSLC